MNPTYQRPPSLPRDSFTGLVIRLTRTIRMYIIDLGAVVIGDPPANPNMTILTLGRRIEF